LIEILQEEGAQGIINEGNNGVCSEPSQEKDERLSVRTTSYS
jgi:hypothetical protein